MTDLTEQWKKGELPNGWYWVKGIRAEGIYAYTAEYLNNMYRPRNGEIIIEQVPSYEEWQAKDKENQQLKTQIAKLTEIVGVLPLNHSVSNLGYKIKNKRHEINNRIKEIDKLKELLKECKKIISENISGDYVIELCERIDNAIGE